MDGLGIHSGQSHDEIKRKLAERDASTNAESPADIQVQALPEARAGREAAGYAGAVKADLQPLPGTVGREGKG